MPSTTSSSVSSDFASSTVITPSLPTFCIALARKSPISRSPLAEMVPTWAISSLEVTFLEFFFRSSTMASTARSMPRFRSIGFMPAATDLAPSLTIQAASTVAVVVPSPAWSEVLLATSRSIWAPMFSNLSSSSISLATVTPSLLMRGAPNDLSSTTLRPLGPSVTFTALARMSTPRSILSRASAENLTSLAAMSLFLQMTDDRRQMMDDGAQTVGGAIRTSVLRSLCAVLCSGEHAHDVGFLHDQQILAVELDFGAGPFSEQHLVSDLHIDRGQLPRLVAGAGAGRKDPALLRLLARGVRNDDAAGGLLLGFDALHEHTVVQRTELGFRHDDLVAAQLRALGSKRNGLLALSSIECQTSREIWPYAQTVKRGGEETRRCELPSPEGDWLLSQASPTRRHR